jgi:predicted thioesterase
LLISRALTAPEIVFGVAEGVGVAIVAALDVVATAAVVGLTEEDVVNVRLDVLDEDETTTELLLAGFEDVYSYD